MTDQLVPGAVTEFVAYVDYVGATKRMEGKKIATFQLQSEERRIRNELK
jgi:hypothetical protein